MGYVIERVEQKECMSIWGSRPPSREVIKQREFEEALENMCITTAKLWGGGEHAEVSGNQV